MGFAVAPTIFMCYSKPVECSKFPWYQLTSKKFNREGGVFSDVMEEFTLYHLKFYFSEKTKYSEVDKPS